MVPVQRNNSKSNNRFFRAMVLLYQLRSYKLQKKYSNRAQNKNGLGKRHTPLCKGLLL